MKSELRKSLLGAATLSLCLAAPLGCAKTRTDTMPPGAEGGGAGADGNNSAPESLSNGGADPNTTPMTESSMPPEDQSSPGSGAGTAGSGTAGSGTTGSGTAGSGTTGTGTGSSTPPK